jgi:hypothetical protein
MAESPPSHPPPREEAQLGNPLSEFETAVDVMQHLHRQGRYQIFLGRESRIRFIGDIDEFKTALNTALGKTSREPIDIAPCEHLLSEIQLFLQVAMAVELPRARQIFEREVFDDDFEKFRKEPVVLDKFRGIIGKKLESVSDKLASETLRDRARRLATIIGPILEDLDIDIVSRRKSPAVTADVEVPFLRLGLRYSLGGDTKFPYGVPIWVRNYPRNVQSFELEFDETDIDLLVARLVQAKELLQGAIHAKIQTKGITEKGD